VKTYRTIHMVSTHGGPERPCDQFGGPCPLCAYDAPEKRDKELTKRERFAAMNMASMMEANSVTYTGVIYSGYLDRIACLAVAGADALIRSLKETKADNGNKRR